MDIQNVVCNTCITKAICLQKQEFYCKILFNNTLDRYNITKELDKNDVYFSEIILQKNDLSKLSIILWNRNNRMLFFTIDKQNRICVASLKSYILNAQTPVKYIKIVTPFGRENEISILLKISPYFKDIELDVS
jgi:hypothetical protein